MQTESTSDGKPPVNPATNSGTHTASGNEEMGSRAGVQWVVLACRIVLAVFFANLFCGLAQSAASDSSLASLFDAAVAGNLRHLVFTAHSPTALVNLGACALIVKVGFAGCLLSGLGIILFLRLSGVLALGLAMLLLRLTLRSTEADLWGDIGRSNKALLALGVLLYGAAIGVTVARWRLLLTVQGINFSFLELARLTLIGVFFNLAIPGAVSGDFLKMAFIARAAPQHKAESVLTIMLDRVIGLLGLFVIASGAVLVALPAILQMGPEYRMAQAGAALVGLGSIGGLVAVAAVELRERLLRLPGISSIVVYGNRILPHGITDTIRRLINALELYRSCRGAIVKAMLLSMLVHTLLAADLCIVGRALGERGLGIRHYFITTQVANAVGGIPVTPGGVGTRDKTTATFFQAFGATPERTIGSIPVTMSLIMMIWSLIGAAVFVISPATRHTVLAGELKPSEKDGAGNAEEEDPKQ